MDTKMWAVSMMGRKWKYRQKGKKKEKDEYKNVPSHITFKSTKGKQQTRRNTEHAQETTGKLARPGEEHN